MWISIRLTVLAVGNITGNGPHFTLYRIFQKLESHCQENKASKVVDAKLEDHTLFTNDSMDFGTLPLIYNSSV